MSSRAQEQGRQMVQADVQTLDDELTWNVYIVKCNDGTLYTGITTNVPRRVTEHNGVNQKGKRGRGATYTSTRRPVELVYQEGAATRSLASKREWSIKRLSRAAKLLLTQ